MAIPSSDLNAGALAAYRRGDFAAALSEAAAALSVRPADRQLQLLHAQSALRAGEFALAEACFRALATSRREDSPLWFNAAQAAMRQGRSRDAQALLLRLLRFDRDFEPAWQALANAEFLSAGSNALRCLLRNRFVRHTSDYRGAQRALSLLATLDQGLPANCGWGDSAGVSPSTVAPSYSVILCSAMPARLEAAAIEYRRCLGASTQIITIPNPPSLASGYNEGLEKATGDWLIFSHDDVDLLHADLGQRLAQHLSHADIIGVAGATQATGPGWAWAGHPYLNGWISYPGIDAESYEAGFYSFAGPRVDGIQLLDGVFLAMRAEVARRLRFDDRTFDGFHHYDLDVCRRAIEAGYRLAVATDLGLIHHSRGNFGDAWRHYAARFVAKHPALAAPKPGDAHYYVARVADKEQVAALQERVASIMEPRGQGSCIGGARQ